MGRMLIEGSREHNARCAPRAPPPIGRMPQAPDWPCPASLRRTISTVLALLAFLGHVGMSDPVAAQHQLSRRWDANWRPEWLSILPLAEAAMGPILRGGAGDRTYGLRIRQAHN